MLNAHRKCFAEMPIAVWVCTRRGGNGEYKKGKRIARDIEQLYRAEMRDSETSAKYRKALEDSCTLTQETLEKLKEFLPRKTASKDENGGVVGQDEVVGLNSLQSELIFDTVRLVQAKNAFKSDCFKTNEDNVKKVMSGDSSVSNTFLLKWEIQTFKNNQQWNALHESLERLPELKINDIVDLTRVGEGVRDAEADVDMDAQGGGEGSGEYDEFIKTLDIPLDSVRGLLWSSLESNTIDKDQYLIPEDSNEKLQRILAESDVKKFRLVQLHDKYYQRKISMLKDMDRKWTFEINKVRDFVSSDVSKMKGELSGKLAAENKRDDEKLRESELERERLELNQVRDNEVDYDEANEGAQDEEEDAEIEPENQVEEEEEDVEDAEEDNFDHDDDEEEHDDHDEQKHEYQPEEKPEDADEPERSLQTAETAEDAEIEE